MTNALIQPHELAQLPRLDAEAAIRGHARAVYLGDHTAIVRTLGRYKLFVDTRDRGFAGHLLLDGFWEMWLTLFCARNLQRGMVAVDVGANCGYYSVMFAEFVGADGRLIAVEPNPRSFDLLSRSIDLNGFRQRATARQLALGASPERRIRLLVPHAEPKNAHIVPADFVAGPEAGLLVEVSGTTLDVVCDGLPRVDFVKIDAEGAEEDIVAGMSELLRRSRPMIVIEVNVARYADAPGFLARLSALYGGLHHVSFDGSAQPVSVEMILRERVGEDWLLVLSPHTPQ